MSKSALRLLRHWYVRAPIEIGLILIVWYFIIQYRPTLGASMLPTLKEGSYVFIDRISYRFHRPARGDVIMFESNEEPRMFFCKRVIGMPGEAFEIRSGQVYIDGVPLDEPYIIGNIFWERPPLKIEPEHYYVIGDNRGMAITSHWQGPVAGRNILGRVMGKGHSYTFEEAR